MPEYTLRIRRYSPETGEAASWQDYDIELDGHRSVLDGILQARDRQDGSIGIRCSCRAAICGSCGVRINGKPGLACHTHLDEAAKTAFGEGWNPPDEGQTTPVITVEPMGNMPVLKDLIVDMDAVHWKKVQRVTPWLIPEGEAPEREYIVPAESMIDVTQTMACIQCGACVSDCLSMEIDPLFIGPAALAKAYRFVGDPRDGQHEARLTDLSEDPHGIYDCTHCFNCIEACPKGVAPMSQIMRLRRIAGADHGIEDRNNGHRHEDAFVGLVRDRGILQEAELLPRSYGGNSWFGKFHPAAGQELASSLPAIVKAIQRRKVTPGKALFGEKLEKRDLKAIEDIYRKVDDAEERFELNLYVVGDEDDEGNDAAGDAPADAGQAAQSAGAGGQLPEERSPNK
jgi:succinate dehydrogenase / fumarate reductase, iron-sulfur subunit